MAKAQTSETVSTKRGFQVAKPSANALSEAKAKMVAYLTGVAKGVYPGVGFNPSDKSKPWNRPIMFAVALVWGFTNDADATAKAALIQRAYGLTPPGRNLGFMAMARTSAVARDKTMGAPSVDWIARANAKGVYTLQPTKPQERVASRAIRGNGKLTGDRPTKATAKPVKASGERANGAVKVSVDKALRSKAQAAERATQRAAKRAAQASQGKPQTAEDAAKADIAQALA